MIEDWKPPTGWRKRWLVFKYRLGQVRSAIRHIWWRWSGERDRTIKERDEARANAEFRFAQMRKADNIAYLLQYPPAGQGCALQIAAALADNEMGRASPDDPCEAARQEHDTGAWNCERERHGEVCWCIIGDELRALDKALEDGVELNRAQVEAARRRQD